MSETPAAKKAKLNHDNPNYELANMLSELADYEKNVNRQIHKYNAYRKAARSIIESPTKITSGKDALKLEGVGKQISIKIDQYIEQGKINKLEKVRANDAANSIKELVRVTGIGPVAAQTLFAKGIKSLEDLKANQNLLNHHQKIGLKHVEDFEKRIPREEMIQMQDLIIKEIKKVDEKYTVNICGSFRRGAATSGDIDILITHPTFLSAAHLTESSKETSKKSNDEKGVSNSKTSSKKLLDKVVDKLTEIKFITDMLVSGDTKFMGVCNLKKELPFRRIDIRIIPSDQYYCGILYFTGSDMFNKDMRKIALEKGYTLNEYSLRKLDAKGNPGKAMKVESEQDIFKYLDMVYKKPEERNA